MNNTLFHPQMTGADAARIASEHGGRLVWRSNRVRLLITSDLAGVVYQPSRMASCLTKSRLHADNAMSAVNSGNYAAACQHIRAARQLLPEVQP